MDVGKHRKDASITKKKNNIKNIDLSEEDLLLKRRLDMSVEVIRVSDPNVRRFVLKSLREEIRSSTSSKILVSKPLKFLRPHYKTLEVCYGVMVDEELQILLADILSVLAFTIAVGNEREGLRYRLLGSKGCIGSWGQEYVRNLTREIVHEYADLRKTEEDTEHLDKLVPEIVDFQMKHNAESEAVDLLVEADKLNLLTPYVKEYNYKRTCLYLTAVAKYLASPDDKPALEIAFDIYVKQKEFSHALQIALSLNNNENVSQIFLRCDDLLQKQQFCFMLARQGVVFVLDEDTVTDDHDRVQLQDIINNAKLGEGFLTLARDLEVMEAKLPKDIYKAHLSDDRARVGAAVVPSRILADTFVNAFVNAGFGKVTLSLLTGVSGVDQASGVDSSQNWLFSNVFGKTSGLASLGMIFLWDIDAGLAQILKFLRCNETNDSHVTAGALLGLGIVSCGINHDCDLAFSLLRHFVSEGDLDIRIAAIMGLGIAYANVENKCVQCSIRSRLIDVLNDPNAPLDLIAFASISLGLVYVGSCDDDVAEAIIDALVDRSESELKKPLARLIPLGLGLLYLGKEEELYATEVDFKKVMKHFDMTLLSCAYAGTGNVRKVKKLLAECAKHRNNSENQQGAAVLGVAMVAMAEEVGLNMAIRCLQHLLQYGEPNVRRAVPLALGLLCISNPEVNVRDTLGRLSHDSDIEVAMAAIISLGLISAGTNNGRIVAMLRSLSRYYDENTYALFCVHIAQGLVHLGKGLLTLNPYHSDHFLLSRRALAGLVTMLHCCLDLKSLISSKYNYVLYYLVLAIQPRMLLTVDEKLKPLSVLVRVGCAVDVAGRAGRPRTMTGFQTFLTPILLSASERAELATEKYVPLSPILEGFVILKENPDYMKEKE